MERHVHCENCYVTPEFGVLNPRKFNRWTTGDGDGSKHVALCAWEERCKFIHCENLCGSVFHGCKLDEHKKLCSMELVSCVNAVNGCRKLMKRRERGSHLAKCPASVVTCTAEWNRWPMWYHLSMHGHSNQGHTNTYLPFYCFGLSSISHHLDVAWALRDQAVLNESREKKFRRLKHVLRDPINKKHAALPLLFPSSTVTVERSCFLSVSQSPSPSRDEETARTLTDSEDSSESFAAPAGLVKSVCRQLTKKKGIFDGEKQQKQQQVAPSIPKPPPLPGDTRLHLDVHFERFTQTTVKPKHMYTFFCGEDFRRDEFASHCKDTHADIQGGMDGWIERRCPLAYMGCSFKVRRLDPVGHTVVFNKSSRSFALQSTTEPISGSGLETLPVKVLVDIISHLDSGSLLNLSLTSKIIRDVIALELDNKGIVVPRWRRRGNNLPGWEVSEFVWKLSTGFEAVRDWKFEDNLHAVTEHLKTCPCFVRSVPTEIVMLCGKAGIPEKGQQPF